MQKNLPDELFRFLLSSRKRNDSIISILLSIFWNRTKIASDFLSSLSEHSSSLQAVTYFRVSPSKVIIERLDSITDVNIAYKSIEDIYNISIFSIETDEVINKLKTLQKNIKHVKISRLFPNGLKIIIESYKPQFFVRFPSLEKSYIITSNGILIYQKINDAGLYFLDLVDPSFTEMSFIDYKEGVAENFMSFILRSRDFLKTTFPTVNIAKFAYFKAEREIHITLESGLIVLLRTANDIDDQILSLRVYNDKNKDFINS